MDVGDSATQEQLPRTVYGLFAGQPFVDSTASHPKGLSFCERYCLTNVRLVVYFGCAK